MQKTGSIDFMLTPYFFTYVMNDNISYIISGKILLSILRKTKTILIIIQKSRRLSGH